MNDMTFTPPGGSTPPMMSSREIAELCEKRHGDVIRDIRVMIDALGDDADLRHVQETKDSRGYTSEFLLPKDLTLTLVAGYNVQLRHRIVKRLEELEAKPSFDPVAALNDPAMLQSLLLENVGKVLSLEARIEADAPKVAFADEVQSAPDAISLGQAAKILNTGRNRLCAWLRQLGWLTRINEPYQWCINSGLLDVKIGSWEHPEKGLQRSVTALVTGKGLAKLHGMLGGASPMANA